MFEILLCRLGFATDPIDIARPGARGGAQPGTLATGTAVPANHVYSAAAGI